MYCLLLLGNSASEELKIGRDVKRAYDTSQYGYTLAGNVYKVVNRDETYVIDL